MRGILILATALLALAPAAHAATAIVNVGGAFNAFSPQTITIDPGDRVTFVNKGGYHNAVADNGSFRCAQGCDGDGKGGSGSASSKNWTASVTFATPGTFGYFCEIHGAPGAGMYGTIVVRAPQALVPAPTPGLGAGLALLLAGALALAGALQFRRRRGTSC
ncbi:MAG TPA: plastocyanin/azurin family copper-binding protein [Rudaea sp.]|nr:plastocyanin/azurin family copper-binding protein [Rudaea sp.]